MARDLKKLAGGSSMSSVSEDSKKPVGACPVTFVNVFEVPVEQIDMFIAQWRERAKMAARSFSTAPSTPVDINSRSPRCGRIAQG
jgi:hypothetical protein